MPPEIRRPGSRPRDRSRCWRRWWCWGESAPSPGGPWRPLAIWTLAAAATLAGLGAYAAVSGDLHGGELIAWPLVPSIAVMLFIAHHLVIPAVQERRWRAAYERYFDLGWTNGVRIVLAVGFVAALWALLELGASLFALIGVDEVRRTIHKPWFAYPATTMAFAAAVHLTDMRAGLVRGVRAVALTLLSWLLPLMALIAGAFLAALPFTGLALLWATKSAAPILLSAASALIVLINAAYQDGGRDRPPAVLRWAARLAAVLLTPLVIIAGYGLALRIGQYGLTPERVCAAACVVVGAGFAAGYLPAALSRGPWLSRIELTNVVTAHLIVAVFLALLSPLADPRRLSVEDQLRRLDDGRVTPARFDYAFLKFQAGRKGEAALEALAQRRTGPHALEIAERARAAQTQVNRYDPPPPRPSDRPGLVTVVGGDPLPPTFLAQSWAPGQDPLRDCAAAADIRLGDRRCVALVSDLDGDGAKDVALFGPGARSVYSRVGETWSWTGDISGP